MSFSWDFYYGNHEYYRWREVDSHGPNRIIFERPLGLVESSFDVDGVHYGGRADLTQCFELEIRSSLDQSHLLERIVLAWAVLRLRHVLLMSSAEDRDIGGLQRCFVVSVPGGFEEAIAEARNTVVSLLDRPTESFSDFREHALNSGRMVDPQQALSKLFILPPVCHQAGGRVRIPFLIVLAHMISDGLSLFHWMGDLIDLLNTPEAHLKSMLVEAMTASNIRLRLPPAQEGLYPPVAGNRARQRWFWAIVRVLRHVRKPLPSGFGNPLRRRDRISVDYPPKFEGILSYAREHLPPMNSGSCILSLSLPASKKLGSLCREAGTSVGAGVFALVALVMMELEEEVHPNILADQRAPFIASFPLNPRPFFNYDGPHDSCMLAFSDGIVMPFLPSNVNLEGRLRLLAKVAHRQLKSYQKRKTPTLSSHSPLRMIATNYLTAVERAEDKLPPEYRKGVNPQGDLPANVTFQAATCGVSSVGSVKQWIMPGKYDVSGTSNQDLIADFRQLRGGVRARDNEFLCGNSSDIDGRLDYSVSYDLSAMQEELVERWKCRMESILEPSNSARL